MAFDGRAADLYERWAVGDVPVHERITDMVENCFLEWTNAETADKLDSKMGTFRVLSLGDGSGQPGLRIVERLTRSTTKSKKSVEVISADFSNDMNAKAKEQAESLGLLSDESPVSLRFLAPLSADDSDQLQEKFLDDSIDLAIMSFSLMFVPDKVRCVSEIARMLKTGSGRAIFVVLQEFSMLDNLEKAVRRVSRDINIAKCLVLKGENAVENLIGDANSGSGTAAGNIPGTTKTSLLRVESVPGITGRMPYFLPICPYGPPESAEEEVAIDMWTILLPDWEGELGKHGRYGEEAERQVRAELKAFLRQEGEMVEDGFFVCKSYVPYIVSAVNERQE